MFGYSKAGVKNIDIYNIAHKGFIDWCKSLLNHGTFSTYCDGGPVCFSSGLELSYRMYLVAQNGKQN